MNVNNIKLSATSAINSKRNSALDQQPSLKICSPQPGELQIDDQYLMIEDYDDNFDKKFID